MSYYHKPVTLKSNCCHAFSVWNRHDVCSMCGNESRFYDEENYTTMSLQEWKDKQMSNNDNKFDIDLKFGQIYEEVLAKVLTDKTIEVKSERDKWLDTGNIAIEYMSRGKLSGIATTKADWWAQILVDGTKIKGILMFPVDELKVKIKTMKLKGHALETDGGDNDSSKLVLLPLKDLFNYDEERGHMPGDEERGST